MTSSLSSQSRNQYHRQLVTSFVPLRWVGYGFLLLALFDFVGLAELQSLTQASWQFQFFGQMVERIPIPLLGLGFIYLGGAEKRSQLEQILLPLLSWIALLLAIVMFLSIPLGIANTLRIDRAIDRQITAQLNQGQTQLEQVRSQIEAVGSEAELQAILSRSLPPTAADNAAPVLPTKSEVLASLDERAQQLTREAEAARRRQQVELFKNSIRWNLGALVGAMLFGMIWKTTSWARRLESAVDLDE